MKFSKPSSKFVVFRRNPSITKDWRAIAIFQDKQRAIETLRCEQQALKRSGNTLLLSVWEVAPIKLIKESAVNQQIHEDEIRQNPIPKDVWDTFNSIASSSPGKVIYLSGASKTNT